MAAAFTQFAAVVQDLAPKAAVVLGSGLGGAAAAFREHASVPFGDIPGLVPTSVHGHGGRLAVGDWAGTPALVCFGRLHFYEGHPPDVVTGPVRVAADLGARAVVLTNAAGGIHPSLGPGSLMAIRGHLKLIGPVAWRKLADGPEPHTPYSPRLIRVIEEHEPENGRGLHVGVYAALTGPSYETPAEIRALAACGADAVGMSTAMEAEAAAALGLEVAAVSCVTNRAAGLSASPLDHQDVLDNAKLAVERLGGLLSYVVPRATCPP
jgi:purine-nucleoside phosphorylase